MRLPTHAAAAAAVLLLAACAADSTGVAPIDPTIREATVSSASPAYVALEDGPASVIVADPAVSSTWDLALSTTTVTSNSGAGVSVHCLCGNATASNAQLAAMTPGNQLAAFEAVTAAQVPADTAFRADVFAPALTGWYAGAGVSAIADTGRLLLLRRGTSSVSFVKARVTGVSGAASAGPVAITLQYAVQAAAGQEFGAVGTVTLLQGARFDFATLDAGTPTDWDVRLDGWTLKVNSGVSGSGSTLGIGFTMPFATLTAATAAQVQPTTFRRDGFASVFGTSAWYKYNITGTDSQIWPTYNVYLVKRGSVIHKVQLTGYYNLAGEARNITIRAARLQ